MRTQVELSQKEQHPAAGLADYHSLMTSRLERQDKSCHISDLCAKYSLFSDATYRLLSILATMYCR